jgi:hypothetical protein
MGFTNFYFTMTRNEIHDALLREELPTLRKLLGKKFEEDAFISLNGVQYLTGVSKSFQFSKQEITHVSCVLHKVDLITDLVYDQLQKRIQDRSKIVEGGIDT